MPTPIEILQQYWGYPAFRPLQEDIIQSVLDGHDTLALMPTGGGKSICFQVPALCIGGLCIVVSPLIALMKDQVYNLRRRKIKAAAIFTGMSKTEIERVLDNAAYGDTRFLYVSPERLHTEVFQARLPNLPIKMVAIDESHCISQWGYDFRPSYLRIAEIRERLSNIPFIALTATATPRVKQDIQDKLAFKQPNVFQKSFTRANLSYSVFRTEDKISKAIDILNKVPGTGIVYVRSRKRTRQIAQLLKKYRISADYYHGGLDGQTRSNKQEAWINNKIRVMVCTNAFGMGIDKPDVRAVVHVDVPDSLEAYYQEAGRGGRDGKIAFAVLLFNQADIIDLHKNIENSFPSPEVCQQIYRAVANSFKVAIGSGEGQSFDFDMKSFCKNFDRKPLEVFNAIKIITDNGWLQLNEAAFLPSRVMVIANKEELYKIQVSNRKIEPYIKNLLRNYEGILDRYVKISEQNMAKQMRVQTQHIRNALQYLQQYKLIDYIPQSDTPKISFIQARPSNLNQIIDKKALNFQKKVKTNNIAAVVKYTENSIRCRSQALVSYFGELNSPLCGVCDICLKAKRQINREQTFSSIQADIKHTLGKSNQVSYTKLVKQLSSNHRSEEVVTTIRWMCDNNLLHINKERIVRWKT